jgi:hypothetical protein
MSLSPDTLLGIRLSATMTRHRFTRDPAPVVAELQAIAGAHADVLAHEAGSWAGYYDSPDTHTLAEALLEIPGAREWEAEGRARRAAPAPGD